MLLGFQSDLVEVGRERVQALAGPDPVLAVESLHAGYGSMEVLHGIDLYVAAGQSLCLIGPNGAGKSTVLNAIFGFSDVFSGRIVVHGAELGRAGASTRLRENRIAYLLQDSSVFPDLSVEENLWLGGYLLPRERDARAATERIFEQYPRLAQRRGQAAGALSGGERRLLEIARALMLDPGILLVDEPSIGLEARYVDLVFEVLGDLQRRAGKTIVVVEQNARKGLEFADVGYVMASGKIVMADRADRLLNDPGVGELFLGVGPIAAAFREREKR